MYKVPIEKRAIQTTSVALIFLTVGLFTSVTILSAFQILFTISSTFYTYLALKNQNSALPKSAWFLVAFAVVALLSTLINLDLVPHPSKNFGRVKYFTYGIMGVYVFKYWTKEVKDKTKMNILRVFFLSIVIAALISFWQYFVQERYRAEGLTHTLRYGYGSGMILLIMLGALLHRKKTETWIDFKFGLIAFITGFIAFYLTYTRGALLGFLCGLPFALYFYKPKLGLTLGGLTVLFILALGGFYLFGTGKYGSRFLVNKNNYSDVIRRSQWQAALIATKEKPVLGWGLYNFHSQVKRIKHQYDLDAKEYDNAHSHNIFLEMASGTGLIGLFFFLSWIITWAIECFKAGGLVRALIVPFGVAFVVSGQFEMTFDANNAPLIFTVYSLSAYLAFKKNKAPQLSQSSAVG